MASARLQLQYTPRPKPVGSAAWIQGENEQVLALVKEHMEDFYYSTIEAYESLNEHMGQIYSKNPVNMADLFKTPRNVHSKTPRTARRVFARPHSPRAQNALGARVPLSGTFAPKVPAAIQTPTEKLRMVHISDTPNVPADDNDEMEIDQKNLASHVFQDQPRMQHTKNTATVPNDDVEMEIDQKNPASHVFKEQPRMEHMKNTATVLNDDVEMGLDQEIGETSDASSPEKPLRKRSFSFTALPGREPLTAKRTRTEDNNPVPLPPTPTREPLTTKRMRMEENIPAERMQPEENNPPPPPPKTTTGNIAPPSPPKITTGKLRVPGRLVKPTGEQPSRPASVFVRVASQFQPKQRKAEEERKAAEEQRLQETKLAAQRQAEKRRAFWEEREKRAAEEQRQQEMKLAVQRQVEKEKAKIAAKRQAEKQAAEANNARVKALEAAARKKEADEKAAQEKAEKKRELERKRAAKAEEERREEEEMKASLELRIQEEKQKEAARRRAEKAKQEEEAQKAHELAETIKRERAQQAAQQKHPRGDVGGTLRQLSKNTVPEPAQASDRPAVQTNPAKPTKRVWQPDDESTPLQRPQPPRPGLQRGPNGYQQNEAKRMRTNEEEQETAERHSVMAPPKRPSNMIRKENHLPGGGSRDGTKYGPESTLAKFPHGYTQAPAPSTANHHAANRHANMFKANGTMQHEPQHPPMPGLPAHPIQTVQVSNAKIPFAENVNPPATAQHHGHAQMHAGSENVQPGVMQQNKFKTPVRPQFIPSHTTAKSAAQSSPSFMLGDNITLPEIHTDSEDEDSDDEHRFIVPDWAKSPALHEALLKQQSVDPETVFGPIKELNMEEMFKGVKNPDRLKRLRDRGSSALWVESGDAITSAEKRRDRELRQRVVQEGGWTFEPNV